jgi:uncharacterized protein with HEPN domain
VSGDREVVDYLHDILDAAQSARQFVVGMDFDTFSVDKKTVYAVTRALEIIGEATKNIPGTLRRRYPQVPWRDMAGMRDKISHAYFGINLRRVFDTVHIDLPVLQEAISRVLEELGQV